MSKKISGVYCIKNLKNNKIYVGSSIDIVDRWRQHKRELRKNTHHNSYLQNSWNKYGENNFEFSILEECNKEETLDREQYYLDFYKSYNKKIGYNIAKNSSAPMMGRKFSEETRKKLSEGLRNRDASAFVRGQDKYNAKFKDEDIIEIKRLIYEGNKILDIASLYNVEPNTITQIKTGERWPHIKTEYDNLILQTPRQKLTEEDIIEIKKILVENKLNIKQIANIFNISITTISAIKTLKIWENIGAEYNELILDRSVVRKLDKNKVMEIKKYLLEGKSVKEIALMYDVDRTSINYIKNNKTWKNVLINEDEIANKVYFEKGSHPGSRIPIVQLTINGEFIREWTSSSEASKVLNIDSSAITKCCKGKQSSSKGYIWKYKSEYINDWQVVS